MTPNSRKTPAPAETDRSSWSRSIPVRLPRRELWELMWRPEGQSAWLGPGPRIRLQRGTRWALSDEAGVWRIARLVRIKPFSRVTMKIGPAGSWNEDVETEVTVRVIDNHGTESTVSIEETGVPDRRLGEVEEYWSRRLDRLLALVGRIRRRRESVRQALVVIHGIGEQEPGAILGSLVESGVLLPEGKKRFWVKPDRVSGSYELRRVTLEASEKRPATDVFEFYWAHIIRDTTLGQVATWLRRLLLRWRVPSPLRPLWVLSWFLISAIAATGAAILAGAEWPAKWFASGTVVALAAGLLWRIVGKALAVDLLGDAARYLIPHPANVAHRQKIRRAGVDLIEELHGSGRYDRIVLLGHSLGSVIAYDIITYAWVEMNVAHRRPTKPSFKDIVAVERNIDAKDTDALDVQHKAWRRSRSNTQPWLITDLITVGSPLAHAEFLMAPSRRKFKQLKSDRTLPTCPPVPEVESKSGHRRVTYDRPYRDLLDGTMRTFTVFHHGAPFAVTRWTNLYFKARRFGTTGDLIGGPVGPRFGNWVRDVPLRSPTLGVAHTWYWRRTRRSKAHLVALREALALNVRAELLDQVKETPAFAFLGDPAVSRDR